MCDARVHAQAQQVASNLPPPSRRRGQGRSRCYGEVTVFQAFLLGILIGVLLPSLVAAFWVLL